MNPNCFKEDSPENIDIKRNADNHPEETDLRLITQEMREWRFEREQQVLRRREDRP